MVLAADSRVTLSAQIGEQHHQVYYDNASKLLTFDGHKFVGAVTYGSAVIGRRTAHSYRNEVEEILGVDRLSIEEYSIRLSDFFLGRWEELEHSPGEPDMTFVVAGFDSGEPYGTVFGFDIPRSPTPEKRAFGNSEFGMAWGGQLNIVSRLIHGFDPVLPHILKNKLGEESASDIMKEMEKHQPILLPWDILPLQDCIDLAALFVSVTSDLLNVSIGTRGVGGVTEVATIRKLEGIEFIQKKRLHMPGDLDRTNHIHD